MKKFILFILVLLLSGCAKLAHMQELLTLDAMSKEGDQLDVLVKERNDSFERLLQDIRENKIKDAYTKEELIILYGEPVFARVVVQNERSLEQWLYRNPVKYSNTDKVYFYFGDDGGFQKWTHVAVTDDDVEDVKEN